MHLFQSFLFQISNTNDFGFSSLEWIFETPKCFNTKIDIFVFSDNYSCGLGGNQSCDQNTSKHFRREYLFMLLASLVELKSKRHRQISCLTTEVLFLNFKGFYGVSTSIVMLKMLRILYSSFYKNVLNVKITINQRNPSIFSKVSFC